ncbi:MAG: WbqC family protein [Pirellulales bacterium]|nr:WbqC family protein [Pirellulales bacterium]
MGDVSSPLSRPETLRVAIHQPNYLPWIGYFDKIAQVDLFVLFDDVQMPQGKSFCSRVKIKGPQGGQWLTVPVQKRSGGLINEITFASANWAQKHVRTIELLYGKAPYFEQFWPPLREVLLEERTHLADLNCALIEKIASQLKLTTRFVRSSQLPLAPVDADQRILAILDHLGAAVYVSGEGSGSMRYVDQSVFEQRGITLRWQNFSHPEYPQLHGTFESHLSILDLLWMTGGLAGSPSQT